MRQISTTANKQHSSRASPRGHVAVPQLRWKSATRYLVPSMSWHTYMFITADDRRGSAMRDEDSDRDTMGEIGDGWLAISQWRSECEARRHGGVHSRASRFKPHGARAGGEGRRATDDQARGKTELERVVPDLHRMKSVKKIILTYCTQVRFSRRSRSASVQRPCCTCA